MVNEELLLKHSIGLATKRIKVSKSANRRFVFLTDVFEFTHDENSLAKELNISKNSLTNIIDYEVGVIFDPWASVIALNYKEIPLYETTLKGHRVWER